MPENKKLPTAIQINAAQKLYKKMEYWQLEDRILAELKEKNPNLTDQRLTLIKATLVNSFYNAGCSEIDNVTSWVVAHKPDLLEEYRNIGSNDDKRIELIQQIALCGRTDKASQIEGCIVFASKFAHFFIDANAFPIYDQYASMLVHFYIDKLNEEEQPYSKYGIFYKKFFHLKRQLEKRDSISYSTKIIDCYLWLAGQYVALKKGIKKKFYIASRIRFDDPYNQRLFEMLFPKAMMEHFPDELLMSELTLSKKQIEAWKAKQ
jgi:hypothetical protein